MFQGGSADHINALCFGVWFLLLFCIWRFQEQSCQIQLSYRSVTWLILSSKRINSSVRTLTAVLECSHTALNSQCEREDMKNHQTNNTYHVTIDGHALCSAVASPQFQQFQLTTLLLLMFLKVHTLVSDPSTQQQHSGIMMKSDISPTWSQRATSSRTLRLY